MCFFLQVDVMGFMHFWGLTIDVVSSVLVIVSTGLCVDFSVHVAHAFLSNEGTRDERTVTALQEIGPAVLNGGISTFIALSMLGFSESYVFLSFFKVFSLVIGFGFFHGLVFLPVLLSLVGPSPYSTAKNLEAEEGDEKGQGGRRRSLAEAAAAASGPYDSTAQLYCSSYSVISYL